LFLFDCCRTKADALYANEKSIGSRILSLRPQERGHTISAQEFVLFPTLDGEEAFGRKNAISVYTGALIDALSFAAADHTTGRWRCCRDAAPPPSPSAVHKPAIATGSCR